MKCSLVERHYILKKIYDMRSSVDNFMFQRGHINDNPNELNLVLPLKKLIDKNIKMYDHRTISPDLLEELNSKFDIIANQKSIL